MSFPLEYYHYLKNCCSSCVKYSIYVRRCIRSQPGSSWRVSAPVQVAKDNSTAKGNDQCSHLYAVHDLATAAVASSLCMRLFHRGARVSRAKLNVASACVFVVLYLNAAPLGKPKVLGLPLVVERGPSSGEMIILW